VANSQQVQQRQARVNNAPTASNRFSSGSNRKSDNDPRDYLPTRAGEKSGHYIGVLEVEFLGAIILIFLTVFTDQQSEYGDKMLAVMKRSTLASILFFILALFATSGPNAARFAKAMGALVVAGIFLSTAGQGTIDVLDTFIKADWTSGNSSGTTPEGNSSANAQAGSGTGTSIGSIIGKVGNAAKTAAGQILGGGIL
jgi:hypothetical protein